MNARRDEQNLSGLSPNTNNNNLDNVNVEVEDINDLYLKINQLSALCDDESQHEIQ
jgi:hypothetical protein